MLPPEKRKIFAAVSGKGRKMSCPQRMVEYPCRLPFLSEQPVGHVENPGSVKTLAYGEACWFRVSH